MMQRRPRAACTGREEAPPTPLNTLFVVIEQIVHSF